MAAGLFKLKQHKDNPQQIPIGTFNYACYWCLLGILTEVLSILVVKLYSVLPQNWFKGQGFVMGLLVWCYTRPTGQ